MRSPHQLMSAGCKRQGDKSPVPAERLDPTKNWPQRNMVTPCQHSHTCGRHNWSHGTTYQNLITDSTTTRKPQQLAGAAMRSTFISGSRGWERSTKIYGKKGGWGGGGGSGNAAPSGAVAGPAPGSLQSDAIGGVTGPLRRFPTCICHCVPGAVCRCLLAPRCLSRTSLLLLPLPARPRPPGPQPACTAALGRTRTRVAS